MGAVRSRRPPGQTTGATTDAAGVHRAGGAPDCPNRRWTEDVVDVASTGATLTAEQPPAR